MKHAVIVAHPNPESLNLALARAYASAVESLGHTATLRDLYRLGFDPRLPLEELPHDLTATPRPDVAAERAAIGGADVFVFVYPLWFNAPPAMMKGYWDRVFGYGFGFSMGDAGNRPALSGRSMLTITTSGAPQRWVRETGSFEALRTLFDRHVAAVCGLSAIEHLHFGDIIPNLTPEAATACLEQTADMARRHFGVRPD
ncbi:NAD(P)H-dependent oxidoreductase [Phenylobacterium montanum]|uniref:NAD(P)H-dependent oxidoreductase n=1 Tax=Phenylobacterium montanum TaxID=2823693 RepID=A0A975IU82_9CAUL|nr:NAD(P)H-dependent oxidoreductase [Caulobacter sp. S6]QUD87528.1 NAD(P)H-dependent oxidoreductase [Caulobacter sp. S6]